ncbi:hypothetical protein MRS44_018026 [Fusarium solani]|uniref:uncharacterized protein n=1 Tax=Fusarium solani TaxID=169388 RepID=UPI0032C4492E|nr:hypothetical protein MRS44_018026 [Fusarium solani]
MPSVPKEVPVTNAYDDNSFIEDRNLPATTQRGYNFQPQHITYRALRVKELPNEPLDFFLHFVPYSLVERWVQYTNIWIAGLLHERPLRPQARLRKWRPTTVPELYIWLAILLYIGSFKESKVEDIWKIADSSHQRPNHSIIKYMTFDRWWLLFRHLRIFPLLDHCDNIPRVFQAVAEWSNILQSVTLSFIELGSHISVDEGMIRYTGRSKQKTKMKNKQIKQGLKAWGIGQQGILLRWLWHSPGKKHGPVGLSRITHFNRSITAYGHGQERYQKLRKKKGKSETTKKQKKITLNPTQSVVPALVNLLPQDHHYHVFFDNLFNSPNLLRVLRISGHAGTGTARVNSGIYRPIRQLKKDDTNGARLLRFNEVVAVPTDDNLVNQIAWKDNALVLFMTTLYTGQERILRKRKRPNTIHTRARPIQRFFGNEKIKEFEIPSIAADYNDWMNGVDRSDQLRASQGYKHPYRRGAWQALAWSFLLEIMIGNSYSLQLYGQPAWDKIKVQRKWRELVTKQEAAVGEHQRQCEAAGQGAAVTKWLRAMQCRTL